MFFDAKVDTRSFYEHFLPVFHDCVVTAKGGSVMCSYGSLNGRPTCGDADLLNGVLREQWKWPGFVVSDYDAWRDIFTTHHFTETMEEAAAVGINAGLDQEGGGTLAIEQLQPAVSHGLTNSSTVATAFGRLMRVRMRLGMFDPPTLLPHYNRLGRQDLQTPAATALNRRAAASGMTLLKNGVHGGEALLPLDAQDLLGVAGSVLVSGPTAANANNTLGNYACNTGNCTTNVTSVLDGLRNAGSGLTNGEVHFIAGCETTNCHETSFNSSSSTIISAAAKAKVVVLALGTVLCNDITAGTVGCNDVPLDPNAFEREGHDRPSISLAGNQYALATALASSGTPLLCVLIHGGSIKLGSLLDDCLAIVDAWVPGQQGGAGLADVIFGKVSPAGRSPQTYYADDAELPRQGNMDLYAGRGTTYRYYRGKPTIPFVK